ncbi:uncharacterized protein ATNIH1004_001421 [Aspergillus tanneri]|uniref:Uncharacterized protein n=1 Tax=Aspergillus tanneri TaxID=1220188 RepID=A0A5M9ND12_9EURO|nr:uncharacterized protein ATNIH1004_001421 [Aspergillus tanneri]KAA8652517.1 hypothetical protein ATNIH1004_001421 [Aspergillus tanneri]
MGRDVVSTEAIQRLNGIDIDCQIHWHDARPDYSQWSTECRMEQAVVVGLRYMQSYLRPQVIITQGVSFEDSSFSQGVRSVTQKFGIPHIALPGPSKDLLWLSSLEAWNDIHIEVLLQVPPKSSGSVIRLIRSLEEADYLGSIPSLSIELPRQVDPQLLRFLQEIKWPPQSSSKVTLRRYIQPHPMNSAEASLKTIEAFYPRDPNMSHVLMLAPQTELSPSFYHYLKYTILRYKYSKFTEREPLRLFGISLELPSTFPNNEEPFTPPHSDTSIVAHNEEPLPLFLWQAPNSNATLYFGDKWVELHSFLSNRLAVQEAVPLPSPQEKTFSRRYPAVMEYILELMRTKGYYLLYPGFLGRESALATVHSELYQLSEEFSQDDPSKLTKPEINGHSFKQHAIDSAAYLGTIEKSLSRASTS